LGYLVAWFTLTPNVGKNELRNSAHNEVKEGTSDVRSKSARPTGTSNPERARLKLAEHWENADMGGIIEKIGRIKTFESNTSDTGLSHELCEYLAISRAERTAIDSAIQSTLEEFKRLQRSHIETTQVDDSTNNIVIKQFPNEGETAREALHSTILETLGGNRYFLFTKISGGVLNDTFLNFGEADVHITVKVSGVPGTQRYETMLSYGTVSRRFETEDVPAPLAHLLHMK
jgi:hypothetical protein